MTTLALIYTVLPTKEAATNLANHIIKTRQGACVNIFPCQSFYEWSGEIHDAPEYGMIIKTTSEQCSLLTAYIAKNHPYQTPAILYTSSISAWPPFGEWINSQVTSDAST